MLSQTFTVLATVAAVATASPLAPRTFHRGFGRGGFGNSGRGVSFDQFGGSLSNFDNFHGVDNFSGFSNRQIIVQQSEQVVCRTIEIEVIQQRLAVIQEFAKRIITEQVCEVETQVVAFQQFVSGCNDFQFDLHRRSGRQIGFDSAIAGHAGSLIGSDGSLTSDNFNFRGSDIGSSFVPVGGSNWDDSTSPQSVGAAFNVAQSAAADSSAPGDVTPLPVDDEPPADGTDTSVPPVDTAAAVNNAVAPPPTDSAEAPGVTAASNDVPPPPVQAPTCDGCSD